jgi:hypothetical protein
MLDFSIYKNRSDISEELMKLKLKELGLLFIRLCTYMEIGNHPDRQTFWTYLENICKENRSGQMVLDQVLTPSKNETLAETIAPTLDKHIHKV